MRRYLLCANTAKSVLSARKEVLTTGCLFCSLSGGGSLVTPSERAMGGTNNRIRCSDETL